ncbi:hypothetical protein T492DRAFT_1106461 [Pavlovales sp. CCMP2436]|nr:hypothetical protein T492DRAFT_1106461 [Pavlovales sp. CCMP2436]
MYGALSYCLPSMPCLSSLTIAIWSLVHRRDHPPPSSSSFRCRFSLSFSCYCECPFFFSPLLFVWYFHHSSLC